MKININLILRCTVSITIVFFKKVYNLCFTHNLNKVGSIYFGLLILLLQESDMTEQLHFRFSLSCIGEGNGNPLQCFCLENPRDRGAWWAAVCRVAQSRTRLKRLSSSSLNCILIYQVQKWVLFSLLLFHVFRRRQWHPTPVLCLENPMDGGAWQAAVHWGR